MLLPSDARRIVLAGHVLMLVTAPMEPGRAGQTVAEAAMGGVNMVQVRDPALSDAEMAQLAATVLSGADGCAVVVNGSPVAARAAGAHGVHLAGAAMPAAAARAIVGTEALIGRSVHTPEAAAAAEAAGADYVIAGTIFASGSHPGRPGSGLAFLANVCRATRLPVIAIGGITPERAAQCMAAGAAGVAVVSGILHAARPGEAAARYRAAIGDPNGSDD